MDFVAEEDVRKLAEANLNNVCEGVPADAVRDGVEQYTGKVRENFTMPDGEKRILVTTDQVSAFDARVGTIPFKGQVLDTLTHWWFEKTRPLVPDHIKERPAPVITLADECEPLMVEMVVRGYLTGSSSTSIWRAYDKDEARIFCGHPLPDGMKKNQRLPYVMVTPSTKAAHGDHDVSISAAEVLDMGLLPGDENEQEALWEHLNSQALALFGMGTAIAASQGYILVDTKYEFGRTADGRIVVIDEAHTPDSSRYWVSSDYAERFAEGQSPRSMSKQFVRNALTDMGYDPKVDAHEKPPMLTDEKRVECAVRYVMLCQELTGQRFEPDTRSVGDRVYDPLEKLAVLRR